MSRVIDWRERNGYWTLEDIVGHFGILLDITGHLF